MRAQMRPGSTVNDRLSSATTPPKRTPTFSTFRSDTAPSHFPGHPNFVVSQPHRALTATRYECQQLPDPNADLSPVLGSARRDVSQLAESDPYCRLGDTSHSGRRQQATPPRG